MKKHRILPKPARNTDDFQYDVCLSFAGEDRQYVERVAQELTARGVRVFYDRYERVELWGKDLFSHLDYVYRSAARYCVVFASRHYASKLWTNHERKSAQARAFAASREYILPVRFDDTEIPGLLGTVGYLDLHRLSARSLADSVCEKLGPRQRKNFLPPVLDRLHARLHVTGADEKDRISNIALSFFEAFQRMSPEERKVVSALCIHGCCADLPENVHVNLDLLRRVTGFPVAKTRKLIAGLRSLGFYSSPREDPDGEQMIEVKFMALSTSVEPRGDETGVVLEMAQGAVENLCAECGADALMRADFSQLAAATSEAEVHRRRKRTKGRIPTNYSHC